MILTRRSGSTRTGPAQAELGIRTMANKGVKWRIINAPRKHERRGFRAETRTVATQHEQTRGRGRRIGQSCTVGVAWRIPWGSTSRLRRHDAARQA